MEIKQGSKQQYIPNFNSVLNDNFLAKIEQNQSQGQINQSSTIESYNPKSQNINSYTKTDLGENDITNIRLDEKEIIDEDTKAIVKITNRIIKAVKPMNGSTFYEKKIISKTITKESPTETTIIKTSNILNENSLKQNHNKATYTRPLKKGKEKYKNIQNTKKITLPKTNIQKYSNNSNINSSIQKYSNKSNINSSFQLQRNEDSPNKLLISSQSFAVNKLYLNKPDLINTFPNTQRAHSPGPGTIKRKTITRGEEVKNVQITHVICSKKPANFHITEKLETNNIKSNPIQISKTDREKLKKGGKSSFTSSCQDNVKPIVQNLKGKTTVYQHARGIGMTNDRRGNINPLFYNSEIKKLEPIMKEKEKVKVEYIENFRSNKYRNGKTFANSTRNLEKQNNYKNFNTVANVNNRNGIVTSRINMNN